MRKISYCQAVNEAMSQEMDRDPSIFVYGIGVPDHKRVFGTTVGLLERFGRDRCFDTPLSEDAMTGFGLGAAINGARPIHVHMRVDFMLLAMNQLANMVASYRYTSGGTLKVPLVIRAVVGRGWGQAFQHSKTMHSCFAHIPGLKVVMPTTPRDAKGLLISAIRDDNPVIVIEHRWLYYAVDDVPEDDFCTPIGRANVLMPGDDVTVIATSWMNVEALRAAELVRKKHGVSAEVIDARSVAPLDDTAIIDSVEKTGHCIVVDNDWIHCGFSAEIAARIAEKSFGKLKSPVRRMGFEHTHCPCTRHLENAFYPSAANIVRAIETKLSLQETDLSGETFYSYEHKFKGPF
ncbi:MAG: alpha-ketoacid dehydrogenase subunit beta [Planctomycetota bacterium]|jgi:pyruvate dehydrogenase E1 component beta subunit